MRDWIVDYDRREDGANQIVDRETGHTVAFVATGMDRDEHDRISYRLAAAQALYDALDRLADYIERDAKLYPRTAGELWQRAKAALAKADGRTA